MKPCLLPLIALLAAMPAAAAPGGAIGRLMQTPASAFDLFLLRLYESAKCNRVVRNDNIDEADLCVSTLAYDPDGNQLNVFFRVLPFAEPMDEFVDSDADGRRDILLDLLDNTVKRFGAVDTWGLLHNLPLGFAAVAAGVDERAFRRELAARTTVTLTTSHDGTVYVAKRRFDGKIEYFTSR